MNFYFKGEHFLSIGNASIIDDTKYQCQVTAFDKEPSLKSDWAFLTVLSKNIVLILLHFSSSVILLLLLFKVKPSNLYISTPKNDTFVRLINNKSTTINCIAENSNPGCDFIWYLGS